MTQEHEPVVATLVPSISLDSYTQSGTAFRSFATSQPPDVVFETLQHFMQIRTGGTPFQNANQVSVGCIRKTASVVFQIAVTQPIDGILEFHGNVFTEKNSPLSAVAIFFLLFLPVFGWIVIIVMLALQSTNQIGDNSKMLLQHMIDDTENRLRILDARSAVNATSNNE